MIQYNGDVSTVKESRRLGEPPKKRKQAMPPHPMESILAILLV
jgi:hypothetical protein